MKLSVQKRKNWTRIEGGFLALFFLLFYLLVRREISDLPSTVSIWLTSEFFDTLAMTSLTVSAITMFIARLMTYKHSGSKDEFMNYHMVGPEFFRLYWPYFRVAIILAVVLEIWIGVA